jgi:hypothetical protein
MVAEEERPIGSPILPERRRDRLSVWVAEHRWTVSIVRVVSGLTLVVVMTFVFGVDYHAGQLIAFVVGAALGGQAGERETERGDRVIEILLSLGDLPAPPESVPSEFSEYFRQPADPRTDARFFRPH